jgi:cadmium resistance protein CadD (predicted permease)
MPRSYQKTFQSDDDNDPSGVLDQADPTIDGGKDDDEEESNFLSEMVGKICSSVLDPFTLEVTVYALVCSSDNIAIYIALFASMKVWETLVIIVVFYILLAFNCLVAIALMRVRVRV